jgi:hypothetical protein
MLRTDLPCSAQRNHTHELDAPLCRSELLLGRFAAACVHYFRCLVFPFRIRLRDFTTNHSRCNHYVYRYIALGYNQLWIDVLCIVQDGNEEKIIEIAKMPVIYGHAACTVAASRSATATEGLLSNRIPNSQHCPSFNLPYQCAGGSL